MHLVAAGIMAAVLVALAIGTGLISRWEEHLREERRGRM